MIPSREVRMSPAAGSLGLARSSLHAIRTTVAARSQPKQRRDMVSSPLEGDARAEGLDARNGHRREVVTAFHGALPEQVHFRVVAAVVRPGVQIAARDCEIYGLGADPAGQ